MSNDSDSRIKMLLEAVEVQKANLGKKPKANQATNAIFKYNETRHININTVKDPLVLVDALAFLLDTQLSREEAATRLGVTLEPFIWNGFSSQDWEDDFRRRIEIIEWTARKVTFDATKKKLKSLVSEEARTEMELDDISKSLQL